MDPDISVIIPFYNGERWLPRALASVLAQRQVSLEAIVVDDGSDRPPDAIVSSLADTRIRLLTVAHGGKGAAVNAGIRIARGGLVCVLDQDDEMLHGRLAVQAARLLGDAAADAVYSDYERRDAEGALIDLFTSRQAATGEMLHCLATGAALFSTQTLLLRKSVVEAAGAFCPDERLGGLDDVDFFVRLLVSGCRFRYVPGVFGRWTSHGANYSRSARFQEGRLFWLARLDALADAHPPLRRELPHFRTHHYTMLGLFRLHDNDPAGAARYFARAIAAYPYRANTYYLFLKSLARHMARRAR